MKRENPFGNVADKNPLLDGQEDNNIFNRDKGFAKRKMADTSEEIFRNNRQSDEDTHGIKRTAQFDKNDNEKAVRFAQSTEAVSFHKNMDEAANVPQIQRNMNNDENASNFNQEAEIQQNISPQFNAVPKIPGQNEAKISLVLGIIGMIFSFIGMGSAISLILGIIGAVYASKSKKLGYTGNNRIIGLLLSVVSIIAGIVLTIVVTAVIISSYQLLA